MISFLTLKAADLEQTANVFRAIGFDFVLEQHGEGPIHLASSKSALVVEIYPGTDVVASGVTVGVEVDTLEGVTERCKKLNVTVKHAIEQVGGFRRIILQTPEDAEIFVHETSDGNG